MRVAVISDIHANLHALEAVLAAVDAGGVRRDLVPRRRRRLRAAAERVHRARAGAGGPLPRRQPRSGRAREDPDDPVRRTTPASRPAGPRASWRTTPARSWRHSQPLATRPGVELFHASPRDPVWDYVLSEDAARESFAATTEPLVLVGHSHVALELASDGLRLLGGKADGGIERRPRRSAPPAQPRLGRPAARRRPARRLARARHRRRTGNVPPYRVPGRADAGRDARRGSPRDPCRAARARRLATRPAAGSAALLARSLPKVMPSRASASWTSSRAL